MKLTTDGKAQKPSRMLSEAAVKAAEPLLNEVHAALEPCLVFVGEDQGGEGE